MDLSELIYEEAKKVAESYLARMAEVTAVGSGTVTVEYTTGETETVTGLS
jgi:hypothetical protein